ncbi:MAG TPA: alkaline phosphatase family protein, partial [Chloroflexia bacterium]|nr:alkaline phosphatase family protein [Chloroflexia bacterium]
MNRSLCPAANPWWAGRPLPILALLMGLALLVIPAAGGLGARATEGRAARSTTGVPQPDHVVVVMEENHAYGEIIGAAAAPYINGLAQQGALFTDSHGVEHPSQPNYLDLFSGGNQGVTDDSCPHTFATANLGSELIGAGLAFTGYSEDLPAPGSTLCTSGAYARKHSPWINFTNVPTSTNLPFSNWPADYTTLPAISVVVPNLNDDMHDGTIAQGDTWLQLHLNSYVQWAATHNSLLIVQWDEDDYSTLNHIPTFFDGPMVVPGQYPETINHYNILRTLEDMYNLPYAGQSASASPITDVWTSGIATLTPTSLPSSTPPASATPVPPTSVPPSATPCTAGVFSDVHPTDYFYTPVQYLVSHGVVSGYGDCTFRPYNNTTRSQLAKIVVLGFAIPITTPTGGNYTFADVPPSFAFYPVIETAAAGTLVSGYSCGGPNEPCDSANRPYFRPYADVTRGQLSKITVVAASWALQAPPAGTFADV